MGMKSNSVAAQFRPGLKHMFKGKPKRRLRTTIQDDTKDLDASSSSGAVLLQG